MFIHSTLLLITATWLSISLSIRDEEIRKDRGFPRKQANLRGMADRAITVPSEPFGLLRTTP